MIDRLKILACFEVPLLIEGEGTADKREFLEIAQREGLRAIAWRDARFVPK
jgi:enoyl-CoA hydratase